MIRFRPAPWDVALTVLCAAAMFGEAVYRYEFPGVLGSSLIVAASLPALIRWRAPTASLVLAFVTLYALARLEIEVDIFTTIPAPAVLCAYAVADRHGRRAAIVTGIACLPLTLAILQIYSPHALFSVPTAQNLAWVVLPLALGVAAHERRAAMTALVERARTAERTQEETARRRAGEERLRIARDVHDVVAHALVTINVQAGVGAYLVRNDPDEAHATLRTIKQVSGDALGDLRSTLGLLHAGEPAVSEPGPPVQGIAALDELAENLRTAGLDVTVELDPGPVPTPVGTTAYRIVQEALTNTLRHAGPTTARVSVRPVQDRLVVEVVDEGGASTGPLSTSGSGNGVRGMRERAAAVGGTLEAGPRPTGGWRVSAALPLSARKEAP
ncbi:histidine kinase [Kineosporia mesophila]|uniref:histidine kinase n=1 Tax=Kineosporia mesophila TaxID=566012 RepID=A0ABP7AT33_9ACTN|nr:sensor histidine kinase [Kineosporia mesophila]MCD5353175.1 sensor histidine kinase [Kineosporia mesophila]